MDILQLPDNEPFAVGLNVPVQFPLGELRRLENFTLLFITQGTARVELDFRDYTLHPDSYLGLGAEQFFQCLEASPDFEVSYLTIPGNVLFEVTTRFDPAFFAFLRQYPLSPVLTPDKRKEMRLMLEVSYHLYEEREHTFRLPMFKNCLQNFLMDIYDKTKAQFLHHRSGNTTRQEELLEKFIHLVFQHSSTRRDVQFYADQLCITTRYLSSILQDLTGHTPKELIDSRCIQEIKMLLRTTNLTMQEIAFRLDFPDQSFFSRYFKKNTGMTPAEYRGNSLHA